MLAQSAPKQRVQDSFELVQSNLAIRNFLVTLKFFLMPKVPYPYEVNDKLVTGNGSLIPICSLSNRSLLPSLTVLGIYNFLVGVK